MEERYLVRAKRVDNDEWIEGLLSIMFGQLHIIPTESENTAYPIKDDTLCRCVGKEYMDSDMAWEGDIFESQVSGDLMVLRFGTYQAFCPVDHQYMDSVGFYAECKGLPDMPIGDLKEYALKKGNIFDNPELLQNNELARQTI